MNNNTTHPTLHFNEKNQFHCENGPALINSNGFKEWYINGLLHRDDGPAMEYPNGLNVWYKLGKMHRDGDEPAQIEKDGSREWYKEGICHRENLPAVINRNFSSSELRITIEFWKNGKCHKEDGPAIIIFTKKRPKFDNFLEILFSLFKLNSVYDKIYNNLMTKAEEECLRYDHKVDNDSFKYEYWLNGNQISKEKYNLNKKLKEILKENNSSKRMKI